MLDNPPFPNKFDFPPIRDIFVPSRRHTIIDIDLEGADARVVAWRIGSERMKDAFKAGLKIHAENAKLMFPVEKCGIDGQLEPCYTQTKKLTHGTNYGGTPPTMSKATGFPLHECRWFTKTWMVKNPEVPQWHEEVEFLMQRDRGISNPFGYRIRWFDRPYALRNKGLAWEPQSVVAEVTYRVLRQCAKNIPNLTPLMQVHDSLVLQCPTPILRQCLRKLHEVCMSVVVPYPDPLVIPWGLKLSQTSWGEAKKAKWSDYL